MKRNNILVILAAVLMFLHLSVGCAQQADALIKNEEIGEIKGVGINIKGLSSGLYITNVINALKTVERVQEVKIVDLNTGKIEVVFSAGSSISLSQLETKIIQAVKEGGCACDALEKIIATGSVKEDEHGFYLNIEKSADKVYLLERAATADYKGALTRKFKKYQANIKQWFEKKSMLQVRGAVQKRNGLRVFSTVPDLEIKETQ